MVKIKFSKKGKFGDVWNRSLGDLLASASVTTLIIGPHLSFLASLSKLLECSRAQIGRSSNRPRHRSSTSRVPRVPRYSLLHTPLLLSLLLPLLLPPAPTPRRHLPRRRRTPRAACA